jgi:DNA-binding LacI/PurR family transcriptional regulator
LADGCKFTALICGDTTAPGVYRALQEKGLRIGQDVSVISVDDCLWAQHMHPPLTTVRIPRKQIASQAIEMLQTLVATDETRIPSQLVESKLVMRESTGPVSSGNEA